MSEKQTSAVSVDPLLQAQSIWQKNKKQIIVGLTTVVVIVGGWFGYQNYIIKPKEEKAAEAIFKAEQYFAMDSSKKVLEGDGQYKGVLYIINNYSGTKQAELAKYYAGVSYLKLGDFNNAVKYLKDFSTSSQPIQKMAYGCLGDAYAELDKKEDAIAMYKKAASTFTEDEFNSAEFLFRAALLLEIMGKQEDALTLYKEIKAKYPKTEKGFQSEKYIYRISIEKNEFSVK